MTNRNSSLLGVPALLAATNSLIVLTLIGSGTRLMLPSAGEPVQG